MKKILQITSNYVDAFYKELFSSIEERGYESVVFVPQKIGCDSCPNASEVIKSQCYSKLDRFFLRTKSRKIFNSITETVNLSDISLVHAHSLYTSGVPAYHIFKKYGTPYILSVRRPDVTTFPLLNVGTRCLINEVIKNAKAVIFVSPDIKRKALKLFSSLSTEEMIKKSFLIANKVSDVFL